ncbi:MarR family transcriptional regulator [Vandammella animalimorsus]|uniref:MarR family transcriptional regulator n=1 Tax=Vandammella animalimorsus TaxID=2029117 RepID=A0A2A2AUY0_9BURK|nr:MarR family transcriptional regulator [Vandammella animalimorsus]MDO4706320.1 MarR family transcriptional regulator [Comamonadaceae bacterium]PAT41563.1 MarR family transcriptional regulator [Vandammella animalimorsus]RMX11470.1 MarR family transcriptional regulator [Vandammella animalimorsus]
MSHSAASGSAQARFGLGHVLGEQHIGLEARAQQDDHMDTRLWLRLFSLTEQIEQRIRQMLRQQFDTTLPRFDYLAQLDRHPQGLRMNTLSRYLMVTGGSVTGLTDQLVKDGLVERIPDPHDRRSLYVKLTPKGRRQFRKMAQAHEQLLGALLAGLGKRDKDALYEQLGQLRVLLAAQEVRD